MAVAHGRSERARVLVVEDDESSAMFVTRVLNRHGFEAVSVSNAERAAWLLEGEAFDVLLADYRLPGQSGVELARYARRLLPHLGIAVMTSFAETGLERSARSNGADEFFEKPLPVVSLVERVSELVIKSRVTASRRPSDPPAREAITPPPAVAAPGAPSGGGALGTLRPAEGRPGERPSDWGGGFVAGDTDWSGELGTQRPGGISGASRACPSAFSLDVRHESAVESRAAHPAGGGRRMPRGGQPVAVWAFGAPGGGVRVGSSLGSVGAPCTRACTQP
jgi:CheY-like chemotaxis protein